MRKMYWTIAGATALLIASACSDRTGLTDAGRGITPRGAARAFGDNVTGAVFTSTNPPVDDILAGSHDLCQNQPDSAPAIDCNIYMSKDFVWFTGGPGPSDLPNGNYFFAVLVPGGQGGNDAPNDGTTSNLSDTFGVHSGGGDTWENRVFNVTNGVVTYVPHAGETPHDVSNGKIRLMGYDDTTNPGGEYVMAVCSLAARDDQATNPPGVVPSDCKYDNFKIRNAVNCPNPDSEDCQFHPVAAQVVTEVHLSGATLPHTVVDDVTGAPLGSTVHDKATVTTTDGTAIPGSSKVTFVFYSGNSCGALSGSLVAGPEEHPISGPSPQSYDGGLEQTPVALGEYSYRASFTSGNTDIVQDAQGECEPFKITKANSTTTTDVHDAGDNVITNTSVALGTVIHDKATVTGVGSITPTGTVTFKFYKNNSCTGDSPFSSETVTIAAGEIRSASQTLGAGAYGYKATYNGDANYNASTESGCEPVTVNKANSSTATDVHNAAHTVITNTAVALGTSIHDIATVTTQVGTFTISGSVTFKFYNGACTGTLIGTETVTIPASGEIASAAQTVGAGDYGYKATYNGDANYNASTESGCEPITIHKENTTTTTDIHDAAHNVITNTTVAAGTVIHDKAVVGTKVGNFVIGGTVTFRFYNGACTGSLISTETVTIPATGEISSPGKTIATAGAYGYKATYNGDANYNGSTESGCEPITLNPLGKTMGFWGNTNGIARIEANGNYSGNVVDIGRGGVIDTKGEALKILPSTLNACGKFTTGSATNPQIFFGTGAATTNKDCVANSGINIGTLNTAAAQTLALGYNRLRIWTGYPGMTVGSQGCSAYLTAALTSAPVSLTAASSMTDVFNAAQALINTSSVIAPATGSSQAQLGALNSLLGCINREP